MVPRPWQGWDKKSSRLLVNGWNPVVVLGWGREYPSAASSPDGFEIFRNWEILMQYHAICPGGNYINFHYHCFQSSNFKPVEKRFSHLVEQPLPVIKIDQQKPTRYVEGSFLPRHFPPFSECSLSQQIVSMAISHRPVTGEPEGERDFRRWFVVVAYPRLLG